MENNTSPAKNAVPAESNIVSGENAVHAEIVEIPASGPDSLETPVDQAKKEPLADWILFFRDICIILVFIFGLRGYVVAPFQISGSSMESNYHNGELILVDKISYGIDSFAHFSDPKRGDVVVIEPHTLEGKDYFIKRIIGLPGETVKLENGVVSIKQVGKNTFTPLNETYLNEENLGKTNHGITNKDTIFEVPAGQYFIMGDNRNYSSDARDCFASCNVPGASHFLTRENIVGKLWATFGTFNVFKEKSLRPFRLTLADHIGFSVPPRFLDSPKSWDYPELK